MSMDALSSVPRHVVKTPDHLAKRAILHSKGAVPKNKLLRFLHRALGGKKHANLPAQLKTSVRDSGPTGTCIPIATKDGAKTEPDFLKGTLPQALTPEEMNECGSAPPTGGALSGEFAELGEVFNGVARMSLDQLKQRQEQREQSEQVLRRKSERKNLVVVPAQATGKASAEAAPAVKRGKASRRAPVPDEPPPNFKEAVRARSAPALSDKELKLRARRGPPPSYAKVMENRVRNALAPASGHVAEAQKLDAGKRKPKQDAMIQRKVEPAIDQSALRAAYEQRVGAAASKPKKN